MSNSCHMQYGHALRWAWGCLMRSSLILGEGGRMRGERDKKREKKSKTERDPNHKQNSSG